MINRDRIKELIVDLYKNEADSLVDLLEDLVKKYDKSVGKRRLNETDTMLITYGDSILSETEVPLKCLKSFMKAHVCDKLSAIHLLPFYPYSSDDGFSVIDYRQVNTTLGSWEDVTALSEDYDLMFDAVINHISSESDWVRAYREGDKTYKKYFIECDPTLDYSLVTRPRALPLLTELMTDQGKVSVWTTFSADQIDLNFQEPQVLLEIMDILLTYIARGARYIRLDAIGFLWKRLGTTCMHLEETHKVIKLMRLIIEEVNQSVVLITETNTPHVENISYFGNGNDEAHMVYQFPLPPLTLHAFMREDAMALLKWLETINNVSDNTTFFNFLASHDGIGLRPVEGLLEDNEVELMAREVIAHGGKVSYRTLSDGSEKPYEMNINYLDALCEDTLTNHQKAQKFIASQAILLSIVGVPGIYIHSLLGSRNDVAGMVSSGINRRINREKLKINDLNLELSDEGSLRFMVLSKYLHLLNIRKKQSAFSPFAQQKVVYLNKQLFSIVRHNEATKEHIEVVINLSSQPVELMGGGYDLVTGSQLEERHTLSAYDVVWRN